jgi:probable O-glycosylation ligase (exosortase A-associated)
LRLNTIVPVTLVLATFFTAKRAENHDLWAESNSRLFVALLGLITISTFTARVSANATFVLSTVVGYVLIYWVIARQATDTRRLKGVFAVLVLVHVVLAALTPEMFTDQEERHYLASGTFLGDGNDFALSVNVAIPLCLFLWFAARKKTSKVLYGAAVLFLILCVVATRSRGGTIALGGVGAYYWLKTNKKLKTGLLGAVAVAMILVVAPPTYFARMDNLTNTEEGSAQGRIKAWNAAVWMAISNPALGVGAGNFAASWGKTAHSIYFLALGELGLPGLFLFIVIIASNLRANRRLVAEIRRRDPTGGATEIQLLASTSAALIAFAAGGAFLSANYYPHLYVLAGLLVAGRRIARQRLASEAPAPVLAPTLASSRRSSHRKMSGGRIA